jgi:N-acetylneuraminic acid mutarotase
MMNRTARFMSVLLLVFLAGCDTGPADRPPQVDPEPPHSLVATAGNGFVRLSWEGSATQDVRYRVYRTTGSSVDPSVLTPVASGLTAAEYEDGDVVAGVSYRYAVTAVWEGRESAPSNEATATPEDVADPVDPPTPPVDRGSWATEGFRPAPNVFMDAAGGAIDGLLYLVGGKNAGGYLRSLHVYNPLENDWSVGAPLPEGYAAVEDAASVVQGGRLYVFGGGTRWDGGAQSTAAVYDPASDAWEFLPPMPTARTGATAQRLGERIYVVGGMDDDGRSLRSMDVFDLGSGAWLPGPHPPLAIPRDNPASAALHGKMYVFGGRTRLHEPAFPTNATLSSVEVFDPETHAWSDAAPMPTGRRAMNAVVFDGRALVLGGEGTADGRTLDAAEAYDPESDSWQRLTDMPVGRHGAVAGVIGDAIYVATGGVTAGDSFTNDVIAFRFGSR